LAAESTVETLVGLTAIIAFISIIKTSVRKVRNLMASLFLAVNCSEKCP
jgi:hypothetical protein